MIWQGCQGWGEWQRGHLTSSLSLGLYWLTSSDRDLTSHVCSCWYNSWPRFSELGQDLESITEWLSLWHFHLPSHPADHGSLYCGVPPLPCHSSPMPGPLPLNLASVPHKNIRGPEACTRTPPVPYLTPLCPLPYVTLSYLKHFPDAWVLAWEKGNQETSLSYYPYFKHNGKILNND